MSVADVIVIIGCWNKVIVEKASTATVTGDAGLYRELEHCHLQDL